MPRCNQGAKESAIVKAAERKSAPTSRQNNYGISYSGMIVLAMRNSDATIPNAFFGKALTVQDIYQFLQAHIEEFHKMDDDAWKKTQKVVRHTLAQSTYFSRFQPGPNEGEGSIIGRGAADRGGLWTLHPAEGETIESALKRIDNTLKAAHLAKFKKQMVNGTVLESILDGSLGWRNAFLNPLDTSVAKHKTLKDVPVAAPLLIVPSRQYTVPQRSQPACSQPTNILPYPSAAQEPQKVERKVAAGVVGKVTVQNVVCTANLGLHKELDLAKISRKLPNGQYDPKAHNAFRMQLRNPDASVLLFSSGKMVVTGLQKIEECRKSARRVGRLLQRMGQTVRWIEKDFKITNITASVNLGVPIDLPALASKHRSQCQYEPDLFPGAKFQLDEPKLTLVVFTNGKVNIVGAKSVQDIHEGYKKMRCIFTLPASTQPVQARPIPQPQQLYQAHSTPAMPPAKVPFNPTQLASLQQPCVSYQLPQGPSFTQPLVRSIAPNLPQLSCPEFWNSP